MNFFNQNQTRSGCLSGKGGASRKASTPACCLTNISNTYIMTGLILKSDPTPATMLREWGRILDNLVDDKKEILVKQQAGVVGFDLKSTGWWMR